MSRYDTVIIGAGVAGLAAAQRLLARGRNVVVLEARNRIGGRIWTSCVPELTSPIEIGAEFLHADARESATAVLVPHVPPARSPADDDDRRDQW